MVPSSTPSLISCRWDWCRSSFTSIDALQIHVKHEHIWPMKPMRKADIAFMRRMDLQSLHSSPSTDLSITSTGRLVSVSRNMNETPPLPTLTPQKPKRPENEAFDTFAQLSSPPPQAHSPQRLPVSPAFEGLIQSTYSGLSAAVEMFERVHGHKANQLLGLPSCQRSPMHRPLSESSVSSQEVVEQQLTPEDEVVSHSHPLLPFELQIEHEVIDTELRWPTDDELDMVANEGIQELEQPVYEQNYYPGSSPDSARGRCGSSGVPLGANGQTSTAAHTLQESQSQSPPIVLQTQAPYSSQTTSWGQSHYDMTTLPDDDDEKKPAAQRDSLLIVFIHGFKGTESTFENFPSRLHHILSESEGDLPVECVVFPAYETKGELNAAVVRFADWLTTLTVQKEVANGGGAGRVKVVLCGHSMGGLLASDALLEFIKSRPDQSAPLWPRIIACIAFDTPYLGIHPFVFKNSATRAVEYANAARGIVTDVYSFFKGTELATAAPTQLQITAGTSETPSTPTWATWAPTAAYAIGGAVLAGATAGAAYMRRDDITSGYAWASDHMKFVGSLWDEKAMRQRLDDLLAAHTDHGIVFKTFYVFLPSSPPTHPDSRTFVVLPFRSSPAFAHYTPSPNCVIKDEVQAHMGMFRAANNDGYYKLGLETAQLIRQAMGRSGTQRGNIQQAG